MKFQFNKDLEYQKEAVEAVAELFDTGRNLVLADETAGNVLVMRAPTSEGMPVVANELEMDNRRIKQNLRAIQEKNGLREGGETSDGKEGDESGESDEVGGLDISDMSDFSVEMETGTGKTYVYLRTALELHRKYGLSKFIILVPSVAIREGVLKTLSQTREHFRDLYGAPYGYFAYDSKKLSRVREFAQSINVEIMVMTIQSFNSDTTVMRSTPDRFGGESPLAMVAAVRPVVIMDEPQNMESELSKAAIADLNPLFKLRYSATHKDKKNLVYSLTPVEAYKRGLVKKIEVYGVEEDDPGAFVFKVKEIRTQKGKSPEAKVGLEARRAGGEFAFQDFVLKAGANLFLKTKKNEKYAGILVNEIDARRGTVELSNGNFYKLEEESRNKGEIFRTQIRETIKAHFRKQEELGENVKVLSLFFIDKVANYVEKDGIIRVIFEEEFEKLNKNFPDWKNADVSKVHSGYFANAKVKGAVEYKDTTGKTKADKEVYDLIMKNKERLLSPEEPTCFIFSHSALKEGWDNPNIFQICTLNETRATMKKRQEIGRGLRLALDRNGRRIFDPNVNVLTVVANESYRDFVSSLQTEYTEAGYRETVVPPNGRNREVAKFKKEMETNEDFQKLWEQIRRRTKFNMEVDTKELVKNAVEEINALDIGNLVVRVEKVIVDFDKDGKMKTVYEGGGAGERIAGKIVIGNLVERIVQETGITRRTAVEILQKIKNLELLFENPEEFQRSVMMKIKNALNDLLINDGIKYSPNGDVWEVTLFEDWETYAENSIPSERSVYSRVVYDGDGERKFAESLETSPRVKLFAKLPPRFQIETPLGTYNPDWAIVWDGDERGTKLYLVRETKFVKDIEFDLRRVEDQKILCGEKHFKALGVNFNVATKTGLEDLVHGALPKKRRKKFGV
ncbi:MAG TPA: DEAD/DEAH box helicase family protein [Candidatus Paceibacterota bacterium]|nr:DEAD/DEAH box helicase family protein [Candidatus Paceibacterota bacterium]